MRSLPTLGLLLVLAAGALGGCGASSFTPVVAVESDEAEADGAYKIEAVMGIGPVYGVKLRQAGVTTTQKLQEATATRRQRQDLAQKADIPYKLVLAWAQKVELMRIKGIGPRQSNLLAAVGVSSVKELAQRRADNLAERVGIANAFKPQFVANTPSQATVANWIEAAKGMPKAISGDQ
ncbi:MAG TPA: DUF4332 domain-containing protein [Stenomitos sp.]